MPKIVDVELSECHWYHSSKQGCADRWLRKYYRFRGQVKFFNRHRKVCRVIANNGRVIVGWVMVCRVVTCRIKTRGQVYIAIGIVCQSLPIILKIKNYGAEIHNESDLNTDSAKSFVSSFINTPIISCRTYRYILICKWRLWIYVWWWSQYIFDQIKFCYNRNDILICNSTLYCNFENII